MAAFLQAPQYNTAEDLQAFSSMGLASERPNLAPQGIGMSHGLDVPGYDLNQSSSINHTLLLALTAEVGMSTLLRQCAGSASRSCSRFLWRTWTLFHGAAWAKAC
jgi:hypothetical protein